MCRWGCETTSTTYMCKWCGTWFCKECLRGAFWGCMSEPLKCRICFQKKCQGTKVDYVERPHAVEVDNKGPKSVGKAGSARSSKQPDKTSKTKTGQSSKAGVKGKKKKK